MSHLHTGAKVIPFPARPREPAPLRAVPEPAQWLYRLFNAAGDLLYVGVTQCGEERFTEHRKDKPWWPEVATHTIQIYDSRDAVLLAERLAIYREKPRYNVIHNATGRRLYGVEPIPASVPLTREAMERAARGRLCRAWYPNGLPENVISLHDGAA